MSGTPALFSIHDVMPSTLTRTEAIAAALGEAGIRKVTLLVVPDTGWSEDTLTRLKVLCSDGAQLAGHGWRHKITHIRDFRHWLHSTFISRDVAEHLALDRAGVLQLMQDCWDWFERENLPKPALYVPPAWAMGRAAHADLDALPYTHYETLYGIYDSRKKRFTRTPMVGFEADTPFRAFACRTWNRINLASSKGPLRFSIHPGDPDLLLGEDLNELIGRDWTDLYYDEAVDGRSDH